MIEKITQIFTIATSVILIFAALIAIPEFIDSRIGKSTETLRQDIGKIEENLNAINTTINAIRVNTNKNFGIIEGDPNFKKSFEKVYTPYDYMMPFEGDPEAAYFYSDPSYYLYDPKYSEALKNKVGNEKFLEAVREILKHQETLDAIPRPYAPSEEELKKSRETLLNRDFDQESKEPEKVIQ